MTPAAPRRPTSLVTALFGRVVVVFAIMVVVAGAAAYVTIQRQINAIYDGQLIIGANVLRALMADELREAGARPPEPAPLMVDDSLLSPEDRKAFDEYAEWRMFRVWRDGRVVLLSDTGPPVEAPPRQDGFSETRGRKALWRIYTLSIPNSDTRLQVGERVDIRHVLIRGVALELVAPFLLLAPAMGVLIWWSLRDGLRALRALIGELARRGADDLSPLALESWPRDLHPLVGSINRLFDRIGAAIRKERAFVDDAAHQLRTPLAAIRLQAQLIAGEPDAEERKTLTAELSQGIDRASAMTDRLLTLAKLDSSAAGPGEGDLREATVDALAEFAPLAARRNVTLAFQAPDTAPTGGEPTLLRLVASNLIENAINHAPDGSEVEVLLTREPGQYALTVTDAGPGVPEAERERVMQRFYRGSNAVAGRGAGLGLAIVDEAVRLLSGDIRLLSRADGRSGLVARVVVPARIVE